MIKEPRQRSPRKGDVWEQNKTKRRVRIEDTDCRWAQARNVETGRLSQIELWTFTRRGVSGWTLIEEGSE